MDIKNMDTNMHNNGSGSDNDMDNNDNNISNRVKNNIESNTENRNVETDTENCADRDADALIALLDGYTQAGESRIKIDVVEGQGEMVSHQYHHGRCDVGSPWARGAAFDVLE